MASKRKQDSHNTRRRVEQMEAKQQLREKQTQRRKRDNMISVIAVIAVLGLAIGITAAQVASSPDASQNAANTNSASVSATATPSTAAATPTLGPEDPNGKMYQGTITLNGKAMQVQLDGKKAPVSVGKIVGFSDEGYYSGKSCHRLVIQDTFGVLQCGALTAQGASDESKNFGPIENAPSNNLYPAGTIALARQSSNANSNGPQFFITYKDTQIPSDQAGGYTVIGKVTDGLNVVTDIAAGGLEGGSTGGDGSPAKPVTIDSVTLKEQ